MATLAQINKHSDKRDKAFNAFIEELERRLREYQDNLLDDVESLLMEGYDDLSDVLIDLNKLYEDDNEFKLLIAWYKTKASELFGLSSDYFKLFGKEVPSESIDKVDAFFAAFLGSLTAYRGDVTSTVTQLFITEPSTKTLVKSFKEKILGVKGRGMVFNKLLQPMRDTVLQLVRKLDTETAKEVKLDHVLYTGLPLMETSRCFCEARYEKAFTLKTVNSWNDLTWSGKIQGIDVKIAAGGYNCGHAILYVTEDIAKDVGITEMDYPC